MMMMMMMMMMTIRGMRDVVAWDGVHWNHRQTRIRWDERG